MSSPDSRSQQQPTDVSGEQQSSDNKLLTVGWREWVSLPELGLPAIKAKVDTGAKTSAIHSSEIERFKHDDGSDWVAFTVFPIQRNIIVKRRCQAPLVDIRHVTDSGGHKEERYFIATSIVIGDQTKQIELTLAQRTDMLFRMLLGRTTLKPNIIVNPHLSFTLGRINARSIYSREATKPSQ